MAKTLWRPDEIRAEAERLRAEAKANTEYADQLDRLVPAAERYWAGADGRRRAKARERTARCRDRQRGRAA